MNRLTRGWPKPFMIAFIAVSALDLGAEDLPAVTDAPAYSSASVSLAECYARALRVSETLAISDEEIRQLAAQYRRGVGAALPTLSWKMTQLWQDTSGVQQSTSGVQGTLLRQRRPESFFQVDQPILHGFKEYNAVKGYGAAQEEARLQREQAALNLLTDVAEVFYTSLSLQHELDVLASQRDLTEDRHKELARRVRLGRSRESEILSAEVEMASLDAQIQDTLQRDGAARRMLQFLTHVPPDVPLLDDRPLQPLPSLEQAKDHSHRRPDLLASEQARRRETYGVRFAKGGYSPEIDFTGKYYTERVGFNEDVKWDALLSFNVPIFSGLRTRAEVREARSRVLTAELEMARLRRDIQRQVETAYLNSMYSREQARFYHKAVELAERNYKLQLGEYRLGLINNLQVLQVLTDLQELKLRKLRTDAAVRLHEVRLRAAMGMGL